MKLYKFKAIFYPLIGLLHIAMWNTLPSHVLATFIILGCFGLGLMFGARWFGERG